MFLTLHLLELIFIRFLSLPSSLHANEANANIESNIEIRDRLFTFIESYFVKNDFKLFHHNKYHRTRKQINRTKKLF